MECLHCGRTLEPEQKASGWCKNCCRRFSGTDNVPEIHITKNDLEKYVQLNTAGPSTVQGVQKKLSVHISKMKNPRLTILNDPAGYILKLPENRFPPMPESEHLAMQMAKAAGIKTADEGLIYMKDSQLAYITKRMDRIFYHPQKEPLLLAMEDFNQLNRQITVNKYRGSSEKLVKILKQYSTQPALDLSELYLRRIFCFIIGNSDIHMKNFSLLSKHPEASEYTLSPAYDLLPVSLLMPSDPEELALSLNGKKRNL